MPIRNIIFDFGGVLIDLDYENTRQAFEKSGVTDFEKHYSFIQQSMLFDLFDKGKISEGDFRNKLRSELGIPLTDEQIDEAWNAMLGEIRPEKIQLLRRLRTDYKLDDFGQAHRVVLIGLCRAVEPQGGMNRAPVQGQRQPARQDSAS